MPCWSHQFDFSPPGIIWLKNSLFQSTPVATLDDLLPIFTKLGLEEALIKMDCEGSEPRVILGGLNFLKAIRVPVIAMEFAGSRNIVQK